MSPRKSSEEVFIETRQRVCWLYQWLVINDFLRRLCNQEVLRFIWPDESTAGLRCMSCISQLDHKLPYEFALAGYRFGHSMVRPTYRLNNALPPRPIFHETRRDPLERGSAWSSKATGEVVSPMGSVSWSQQSPDSIRLPHFSDDCALSRRASKVHDRRGQGAADNRQSRRAHAPNQQ